MAARPRHGLSLPWKPRPAVSGSSQIQPHGKPTSEPKFRVCKKSFTFSFKKKKKAELASPSFGLFSTEGGSENQQLQEEFANAPSLRESRHRLPFGKVVKTPPWPVESGLCNLDGEPPRRKILSKNLYRPLVSPHR